MINQTELLTNPDFLHLVNTLVPAVRAQSFGYLVGFLLLIYGSFMILLSFYKDFKSEKDISTNNAIWFLLFIVLLVFSFFHAIQNLCIAFYPHAETAYRLLKAAQ